MTPEKMLIIALIVTHLCGTYVTWTLIDMWEAVYTKKKRGADIQDLMLCFFFWEFITITVIFEKRKSKDATTKRPE
jgi:phosphate starvation-inducible membrane PsiE